MKWGILLIEFIFIFLTINSYGEDTSFTPLPLGKVTPGKKTVLKFRGDPFNLLWNTWLRDNQHSSRINFTLSQPTVKLWEVETSKKEYSSPLVLGLNGTTIYIGNGQGELLSINKNGLIEWKYESGYKVSTSPTIDKWGRIFFINEYGKLIGLLQDGTKFLEVNIEDKVRNGFVIDKEGIVYLTTVGGRYIGINSEDGTILWNINLKQPVYSAPSLDIEGNIIITTMQGEIFKFNKEKLVWHRSFNPPSNESQKLTLKGITITSPFPLYHGGSSTITKTLTSPVVTPRNNIIIATQEKGIFFLDSRGNILWNFNLEGAKKNWGITTSVGVTIDEEIVFIDRNGITGMLSRDGFLKWKWQLPESIRSYNIKTYPIVDSLANSYVVVSLKGGGSKFIRLSPKGKIIWEYILEDLNPILYPPVITKDGTILLINTVGNIIAIR